MRSLKQLWWSLLPLLLYIPSTVAVLPPGQSLYTQSVTYCAEAKAILVNQFDISYIKANHSAVFTISAASVEPNLDLSVNIYANAYGKPILNLTIDLCSFLQGVLCPLPQINFTGYGTYPIPTSYLGNIPSLAWTVPDLEAFARITLTNTNTSETAACLQATLSNGWTVQRNDVKWASIGLFLGALVVGLVHSTLKRSPSPATYRWFDVLYVFQIAAALGLIHVNAPSVLLNFALNFSWALGIFNDSNILTAVNNLRGRTGGKLSDTAFPAVEYINRKLSPYNVAAVVSLNSAFESPAAIKSFVATNLLTASALTKRVTIPTVSDQDTTSQLATGLEVYVNSVGIPTANAFDTMFIVYLIAIVVVIGAHLVFFGLLFGLDMIRSSEKRGTGWVGRMRRHFWSFAGGNALRLCLIFLFPTLIWGFFQFTIGKSDSWLSILLAVFAILWTLVPLITVFILSIIKSRKVEYHSAVATQVNPLYSRYKWYNSVGMIYRQYRQKYHFWWFAPFVLAVFTLAGFIGFGQEHPWPQVIGLIVVELFIFVSCVGFRPHKDRKGDWLGAFLSFCRMAAFGLLIALIPSVGVTAIIRTVIAFAIIVLIGLPVVLLFFGVLFNLAYGYLFRRNKRRIEDGTELEATSVNGSDSDSSRFPAMQQQDLAPVTAAFAAGHGPASSHEHYGGEDSLRNSMVSTGFVPNHNSHNINASAEENDRFDEDAEYRRRSAAYGEVARGGGQLSFDEQERRHQSLPPPENHRRMTSTVV